MIKGFTARSLLHKLARLPVEDAFSIDEKNKIIAVADGVTRDPAQVLPNVRTLGGKARFVWGYPRPSPASEAANMFCRYLPAVLRNFDVKDEKAMLSSFEQVNRAIKDWNDVFLNGKDTDYTLNDFAGCVASAAVLDRDAAHFAYIADCGIAVVDGNGNLKSKTADDGPSVHGKYYHESPELKNKRWELPRTREIVRSVFRNNPAKEHSYGVLTGEPAAIDYVKAGSFKVCPGDMLLAYSDGAADCLFNNDGDINGEIAGRIRVHDFVGLEDICRGKVRSEGTLVFYI